MAENIIAIFAPFTNYLKGIPFVYETLKKISRMEKLNRTLNSDEAVALGAGYIGLINIYQPKANLLTFKPLYGMKASLYRDNILLTEIYNENSYTDDIGTINIKTNEIFGKFSIIINNITVSSFYINENIRTFSSDDTISLKFYIDKAMVPSFYAAYLNNNKRINVQTQYPDWALNHEEFYEMLKCVNRIEEISRQRKHLYKVKNDFESLLYDSLSQINNNKTLHLIVPKGIIEKAKRLIEEYKNWFYNGEEYHSIQEYENGIHQIEKIVSYLLNYDQISNRRDQPNHFRERMNHNPFFNRRNNNFFGFNRRENPFLTGRYNRYYY